MPVGNSVPSQPPVADGTEPQSHPHATAARTSSKRQRQKLDRAAQTDLTPSMKAALLALRRAGALAAATYWHTPTGERIENQTMYALYDRYLVKMVLDSRHRRRTSALLTEIGEHAARGIEMANADAFEDAENVYGDGEP
jgi:hypothetical protein